MEKEVEKIQKKILEISQDLFTARGYLSVSMREIAEACGLSKPGLYYYFTNKQELFLAILDSQLDVLSGLLYSIHQQPDTTREKIRSFIQKVLMESTRQAALIRLGTHDMSNLDEQTRKGFNLRYQEKFISPLTEIINNGIVGGEIRKIDAQQATWALLGLIFPYLNRSTSSEGEIQEIAKFIESVFFDGIASK